jgi:hypothetical protein
MSSSTPTLHKTWCGDIPKLAQDNYEEWKDDMILILSAMRPYAMVTGEDPELQPLDIVHIDNYDDCKAKDAEAASITRLSCSPEVWHIVKGIRNPHRI